ncbi:hypothetical protein CHS0354_012762 [Potamilus streckersoni]|uniref:Retinol dehydrogenase 11 n=1 Tax=Potamilus streckersoni TaxID=2493646 RepID=A0AAE0RVF9_9BIVA|nr:hypothetical protein CHS0354_012762 [Potamilus streckersoni]
MHLIISDVMPALCPFLTLVCLPVIILLVLLYVFREVLGSCPPCRSNKRLDGKTVIITGGNAGIGKETAIDLARRGARVILGCRSAERAQEAVRDIIAKTGNSKVVFYILDLADLDSVRQFAATVLEKESRLHILINNAGIGKAAVLIPGSTTKQGFDLTFGTNYLGPFLLTYLLLDLLRSSAPSQIINVSSHMHWFCFRQLNFNSETKNGVRYPYLTGYEISKLGNVLHARELAKRLQNTGVRANSLHPGMVETEIWTPLKKKYPAWMYNFLMSIIRMFGLNSTEGAQTTIYVSVDEGAEEYNGRYFAKCTLSKENRLALDDSTCALLWDHSMKMCDLK